MNKIEITPSQFIEALRRFIKSNSSPHSPFVVEDKVERLDIEEVILYNQLIRYSKEELDSMKEKLRSSDTILDVVIKTKSVLLIKGVLEKNAVLDSLSEDSKWILKSSESINLNVAKTVYWIEENNRLNNRGGLNESKEERNNRDNLLYFLFNYIEEPNLDLTDRYFKDFGQLKEKQKILIDYVKNKAQTNPTFAEYITCKLKEVGADINEYGTLNTILPTYIPGADPLNEKSYMSNHPKTTLWISASDRTTISNMIQLGFRFNEDVFSYQGDNLFMAVLKTQELSLIKIIIPTLTKIEPLDGDWQKQEDFIENMSGKWFNPIAKIHYQKLKLEYELGSKINQIKPKKIKL